LGDLPNRSKIVGGRCAGGADDRIELVRDQATKERPPLVITKDQADFAVETVEGCLPGGGVRGRADREPV